MANQGKQPVEEQIKPVNFRNSAVFSHGIAVVLTVLTTVAYLELMPWLGERPVLMLFFFPIVISAFIGGLGPGLLATLIALAVSDYFLLAPVHSLVIGYPADVARWFLLGLFGVMISVMSESLHRARDRAVKNQRTYAVTLASIGDAVITTDKQGLITFLNREAERLTGWNHKEAMGQPLGRVFRIINEQTRKTEEAPVEKVLRTGKIVSLSEHSLLIAKDDRETAIDDCAAPIQHGDGQIIGVVLVFRDNTEKEKAASALRASEERYHTLFDCSPVGFLRQDETGRIIDANAAICQLTGYSREELIGQPAGMFASARQAGLAEVHRGKILAGGIHVHEVENLTKNKRLIHVKLVEHCITFPDGHREIICNVTDITDRKRVEQSLSENQKNLARAQAVAKVGSWHLDIRQNVLTWSPETHRIFSIPEDQALSLATFAGCIHPADREQVLQAWDAALHGAPYDIEHRIVAGSETKWVRERAEVSFDAQGNAIEGIGTVQDITERKQAEQQLSLVNFALNHVKEEAFLIDEQGHILYANDEASRVLGYSHEELLKLTIADIDPDFPAGRWPAHWQKLKAKGSMTFEGRHRTKAGRILPVAILANYFEHDGQGYNLGLAHNISETRQAEEKLAREQARFKLIFDTIPIGIAFHTTQPDGTVTRIINDAHLRICGLTREQHDEPGIYAKITHPDDHKIQQRFNDQVSAGLIKQFSMEKRYVRLDGTTAWVIFSYQRETYPDGTVEELTTIMDITGRKQLEEQLRHSQKMEALGQLSGGVAHDFNNLLTVIEGYCSIILMQENLAADLQKPVREVQLAAERAANLTRQLLAFSRNQTLQPRDLNLNEVVSGTVRMLQRLLGEHIELQISCSPHPLPLHADAGMIEQILVNLAVNARDAMPGGGELTIQTTQVNLDAAAVANLPDARAGSFACLAVSDTGSGMSKEIQARIFEPFFTTKGIGKGTGLGLATVYGIVQQHHGWIKVHSRPGEGTIFQVYFPLEARPPRPTAPASPQLVKSCGGTETILLTEDDYALRLLIRNALAKLGYQVIEAGDGVAALAIWRERREEIDLILTDLMMPNGTSGFELARQIQQDVPHMRVIFMSGYSPEIADKEISLRDGFNFLPKPFDTGKLAQTVRACLDAPGPA